MGMGSSADGPDGCPDENVLVGLARGAAVSTPQLERHLDTCASCRAVLGVLAAEDSGDAPAVTVLETGTPTLPEAPAAPSLDVGQHLGRYVIEGLLGQGGMGVVYAARDPSLGRTVALKVLRPGLGGQGARARLVREAQAMARLAHPNVLPLFELGMEDGRLFLVMERVEGPTLMAWLAGHKRPWREVLALMLQAGEGLAAAHRAGLVHRDFKPGNVLVGEEGRPRVTDFGLVRGPGGASGTEAPETDGLLTQAGAVPGTPAYMSPEQRAGRAVDARGDQYSFCVTLHEALHGVRPSEARAPGKRARGPRLPRAVRQAIQRGLSARPEERFPSMDALLAALRPALRPRATWAAWGLAGLVLLGAAVLGPRLRVPEVLLLTSASVSLRVGVPVDVQVPGLKRVSVGDQEIADVELLSGERMRLLPYAQGETRVRVWFRSGEVRDYVLSVSAP